MNRSLVLRTGIFTTLCVVCLLGLPGIQASEFHAHSVGTPASGILDASTGDQRALCGLVRTTSGSAVCGAAVTLRQYGHVIAQSTSDESGSFRFENVPVGVYELVVQGQSRVIRVWTGMNAPPAAETTVVIVLSEHVVRAQSPYDGGYWVEPGCDDACVPTGTLRKNYWTGRDGLLWGAAAVTGITLSAIALSKVDDRDDRRDQLVSP